MLKNLDEKFKYVYTGKTIGIFVGKKKVIVHEIVANKDFVNANGDLVKKGDLGGFIKQGVLDNAGNCWVAPGSYIAGDYVRDNALIINSIVLRGEVSGNAIVVNSTIENGKVQGVVTDSVIDGKVRDNATIISSTIKNGAKIGKNGNKNIESVTITGSTIKGSRTYIMSGIVKGSEIQTNYKLRDVRIVDSKIIDENSFTDEEKTLNVSNVEFISENSVEGN